MGRIANRTDRCRVIEENLPEALMNIQEVIVHPDYGPVVDDNPEFQDMKWNDIALLKLSKSLKFNHFFKPICLYPSMRPAYLEKEDVPGVVVGWGKHDIFSEESSCSMMKGFMNMIPRTDKKVYLS